MARNVKVRYKQTIIGAAWAVLQPLMNMIVFTIVFSVFAKMPSDGLPYPIFAYCALLPWTLFSSALTRTSRKHSRPSRTHIESLFSASDRSALCHALRHTGFCHCVRSLDRDDGVVRRVAQLGRFVSAIFLTAGLATAFAVGLWFSALNVRYRDVGYTIPFITQFWMFASPIVYPVSLVPEKWRLLYGLNPLVGVIEGFRSGAPGKQRPDFEMIIVSSVVVVLLLVGGLICFKRMERTFVDEV